MSNILLRSAEAKLFVTCALSPALEFTHVENTPESRGIVCFVHEEVDVGVSFVVAVRMNTTRLGPDELPTLSDSA